MGLFSGIGSVLKSGFGLANKFLGTPFGQSAAQFGLDYGWSQQMLRNQELVNAFNSEEALLQRMFEADQAGIGRNWTSDQAETARAFNRLEAARNRSWQTRMRNTAVRAQMADMRRSGLNPILAGRYGGAAMGSGGQGSVSIPTASSAKGAAARGIMANLPQIGGTSLQRAVEFAQLKVNERAQASTSVVQSAQAIKILEDAKVPKYTIDKLLSDIRLNSARAGQLAAQTATELEKPHRIRAEIARIESDKLYKDAQRAAVQQNIDINTFKQKAAQYIDILMNDGQKAALLAIDKSGLKGRWIDLFKELVKKYPTHWRRGK